jgi:hypothetical protein
MTYRYRYITITALTRDYGISRSTAYRLHHRGLLTIFKLGRRSMIAVDQAEDFVATLPMLPRKQEGAR